MGKSVLPPAERWHLRQLLNKFQLVKDRVAGVATGRHTGFFLGGRGGIGKTFTIQEELRRREVAYKLTNSRLTGRGLVDLLRDYPDSIHLIEDVEQITCDRNAVGVLRSALWGTRCGREGRIERLVTWKAHATNIEFIFSGGIIMTGNRLLEDIPELAALKTRISWLNLLVTDEEIAALMRSVAGDGFPKGNNLLEPEACMEVAKFIIDESSRINRHLDIRLLVNAFEDRLQVEDFEAGCQWKDLVATRLCERPSLIGPIESVGTRAKKKAKQLEIAREIVGMEPQTRLRAWEEKTGGASQATLYRRMAELAELDAQEVEN